jgi:hypothetical protein
LKNAILNICQSNFNQVYFFVEENFGVQFLGKGYLDKDSVHFLYSVTNSSSFFHQLFGQDLNNLDSIINAIKILENFNLSKE